MAGLPMLWQPVVDIAAPAMRLGKRDIEQFLARCRVWKPRGFDLAMQKRLDYLLGDQENDLRAALAEHFPQTYREMQLHVLNIVRRVVHERARVFLRPGSFELVRGGEVVPPEDASARRWSAIVAGLNGIGLGAKLKRIDAWKVALSTVCAEVLWDDMRGMPRINVYAPQKVNIDLDHMRPTEIQFSHGVALEVAGEDGLEQNDGAEPPTGTRASADRCCYRVYWLDAELPLVMMVGGDGRMIPMDGNEGNELPYRWSMGGVERPLIPVVPFFEHDEELGFFSTINHDLFAFQRQWNVHNTDVHHIAELQGFGEAVLTTEPGSEAPRNIVRGPGKAMILPPGVDMKALSYSPALTELLAMGQQDANRFLMLQGLSPGRVFADSRGIASGDALEVEERPVMEEREDRIEAYRPRLDELFRVIRTVNNYHCAPGDQIAEDLDLRWTPGDITSEGDPEKNTRVSRDRIALGLTNPVEVIMEERGLDEDEATAVYERNLEISARMVAARVAGSSALASMAPSLRGETAPAEEPARAADEDEGDTIRGGVRVADQPTEASAIYQYHVNAGVVTINEVRARLGLPPVPGGDKLMPPMVQGAPAPTPGAEPQA